jgi:uncharacterized membrane protein
MWIEGAMEQAAWIMVGMAVIVALYLIVSAFTHWIEP